MRADIAPIRVLANAEEARFRTQHFRKNLLPKIVERRRRDARQNRRLEYIDARVREMASFGAFGRFLLKVGDPPVRIGDHSAKLRYVIGFVQHDRRFRTASAVELERCV